MVFSFVKVIAVTGPVMLNSLVTTDLSMLDWGRDFTMTRKENAKREIMKDEEIRRKLCLSQKDVRSAKRHLQSLHSDDSNVEAAIHHLDDASQDLLSLFALLPEDLHPSLSDVEHISFTVEEIQQLRKPPHELDLAYMQVVDNAVAKFKETSALTDA